MDTEGFSEAQLELVENFREALRAMQKLQLEKQTLETEIRGERRDAEGLVRRIAIQNQEIETLRGSQNPPGLADAGQPIHVQGSEGSQKKALPKCPDGTKRYCPVCLLNIHTFGFEVSPYLLQYLNDPFDLIYSCRELKAISQNIQSII